MARFSNAVTGTIALPGIGPDTATNTVTATIPVGGGYPTGVAITPDGGKAYVVNAVSSTVSVIDTATNTVTATITDAVLVLALVISTFLPSGLTATPKGNCRQGLSRSWYWSRCRSPTHC